MMEVLKTGDNMEYFVFNWMQEEFIFYSRIFDVAFIDRLVPCSEMFHLVLLCQSFGQPWEGRSPLPTEQRSQCKGI